MSHALLPLYDAKAQMSTNILVISAACCIFNLRLAMHTMSVLICRLADYQLVMLSKDALERKPEPKLYPKVSAQHSTPIY